MIDWSRIRTKEDVSSIGRNLLYDDANNVDPIDVIKLNKNLTEDEIEDAFFWKDFVRGLMLITGEPGNGKGILSHMISYKMGRYFNKTISLDTRPREIFGEYIPFSEEMLAEQVDRLSALEKGLGEIRKDGKWIAHVIREKKIGRSKIVDEYDGEVFLRNSVVMLDEFGNKYMSRLMSPTLSIKQVLLKLFNFWRHLNCLMLGVGVSLDDFERKCLDKATWEARCTRVYGADEHYDDPDAIIIGVYITPIKYNPIQDEMTKAGKTIKLRINASEPKEILNGFCWKDIYNTENAQGFELPSSMRRKQ